MGCYIGQYTCSLRGDAPRVQAHRDLVAIQCCGVQIRNLRSLVVWCRRDHSSLAFCSGLEFQYALLDHILMIGSYVLVSARGEVENECT